MFCIHCHSSSEQDLRAHLYARVVPWSSSPSLKWSCMVIVQDTHDIRFIISIMFVACRLAVEMLGEEQGWTLKMFLAGSDAAVSILLVWLGLNHPQRITTQLYVVLTAPLFLQLFDGQITAPLSPFSKGGEGWTILFWFYRFVETQTRRWWNLQDRGVTVLFMTCLLWIRSQNSAINLINGHVALNSKYGLI